ncbi:hypothetical protein OS493_000709 [Desmophyllum pertusum]|uniref:Uncharacterized protein n=1 Tax=Desmophyllum pertusum TaxID=174260 RepID=A0A9X0DEC7_9CNID|nr:hypothetical protein OS493_000709 [Desmophyllum pertusum]
MCSSDDDSPPQDSGRPLSGHKKKPSGCTWRRCLAKKLRTGESIATVPGLLIASEKGAEAEYITSPSSKSDINEEQLSDIDLLFADVLQTNAALTFTMVKNRMSDSLNFIDHTANQTMVRKVYNRVKYLQSREFSRNLHNAFELVDEESASQLS